MKKMLKIAGLQVAPGPSREDNLGKAREFIGLAAERGAQMVCLPQLFSTPWFPTTIDDKNFELAESADGPTVSCIREAAEKNNVVAICPVFEKDNDQHFNTAFVIGADGGIIGKYRKVHVPQLLNWEEKSYFKPGDLDFPVFDTGLGKVGVLLCWDIFFPEGFRILALKGAEIIFAPTAAGFYQSRMKWERAILAAAHANGVFVFRANRVGNEGPLEFYGKTFCAGPDGELLGKPAGSSEGVVLVNLDLGSINAVRNDWVFLKDRRPELYGDIAKPQDADGDAEDKG